MQNIIRSLRLLVASVFAVILIWPAVAQNLSADILKEIYDDCMVGCLSAGNGQICENVCRCTATEVGNRMSESRYATFKSDNDSGNVDDEDAAFMEEVVLFCVNRSDVN